MKKQSDGTQYFEISKSYFLRSFKFMFCRAYVKGERWNSLASRERDTDTLGTIGDDELAFSWGAVVISSTADPLWEDGFYTSFVVETYR